MERVTIWERDGVKDGEITALSNHICPSHRVSAGGRSTLLGTPSSSVAGLLGRSSVMEQKRAERVREGLLMSCWSEAALHPRPLHGPPGEDPCEVSIHHFYIYVQIPNKKVIILPSLYHAFYELVRRLII